jgi:hypothetical protein
MSELPEFLSTFFRVYLPLLAANTSNMLAIANRRIPGYQKTRALNSQLNVPFEHVVRHVTNEALTEMGEKYQPAYCDVMSDISVELEHCIIQVDAKLCINTDGDFKYKKKYDGFQVRVGMAQTSLTGKSKGEEIKGLQKEIIEGKPVYTLVAFLRWEYDLKYKAVSCGLALLPHNQDEVISKGGKSPHENRFILKNSSTWYIHQFSSESPEHIQDSAQSVDTSDSDEEQPDQ